MKARSRELAGAGDRRRRARAGRGRAAVHRVHRPALRTDRRRLRQRVLRLDGLLPDRRAGHDVLAGDAGGDRAARASRAGAAATGDIKDPDRLIAPGPRRRRLLLELPRRDRGRDLRDAVPPLVLATAAATPGFWDWSFDPPLVLVIDLAILYWLGDRRTVTPRAQAGRAALAQRLLLRGAGRARGRAGLADRAAERGAVLGAHDPARAAARRRGAAVRARRARGSACGAACRWTRAGGSPAASARASARRRCASSAEPSAGPCRASSRSRSCCWPGTCRRCSTRRSLEHAARARAHPVLLHGAHVLEAGDPLAAAAHAPGGRTARRVSDRRDDRQLGAGRGARARPASALQLLRAPGEPSRRHLGDGRSAARRRHNVGARLGHVPDRRLRLRPPLARAARARQLPGLPRLASEH